MNRPPPTLAQLRLAHERYLLAKVQTIELQTWGESTTSLFMQTIDEYREMEAAYVEWMVERRRENAADKQGKDRRRRPTV
jgi:hypothetical protein